MTPGSADGDRTSLPNPRQELLLRASLLRGPEALEAWDRWKMGTDIDRVPMPSVALLPLLYQNLLLNEVEDPLMEALKKRYTTTWYNNHVLLTRVSHVVSKLAEAGIETLLLKGAAMTISYYEDHGVRPMGDVDVLVRPEQVTRATELLEEAGFEPTSALSAAARRYMHAAHFTDKDGFAIDLHWRLLWESAEPDSDDDFWRGSLNTALQRVTTCVLNRTDQLFHVCVHGSRWNSAPLRWVADAVTLSTAASSSIDFDRLLTTANRHGLQLPIFDTLSYLARKWSVPVPEQVLEELKQSPSSRLERLLYRNLVRDRSQIVLGNLPLHVIHYLRLTRRDHFVHRCLELPRYLAFVWNLRHGKHVPASLVAKAGRRIGAALKTSLGGRHSARGDA